MYSSLSVGWAFELHVAYSAGLMAATSAGGAALSAALEDGLAALGLLCRFAGVCASTCSSSSSEARFFFADSSQSGAASCSLSDLPMASAVAAAEARFGRVWLSGSDDIEAGVQRGKLRDDAAGTVVSTGDSSK